MLQNIPEFDYPEMEPEEDEESHCLVLTEDHPGEILLARWNGSGFVTKDDLGWIGLKRVYKWCYIGWA